MQQGLSLFLRCVGRSEERLRTPHAPPFLIRLHRGGVGKASQFLGIDGVVVVAHGEGRRRVKERAAFSCVLPGARYVPSAAGGASGGRYSYAPTSPRDCQDWRKRASSSRAEGPEEGRPPGEAPPASRLKTAKRSGASSESRPMSADVVPRRRNQGREAAGKPPTICWPR